MWKTEWNLVNINTLFGPVELIQKEKALLFVEMKLTQSIFIVKDSWCQKIIKVIKVEYVTLFLLIKTLYILEDLMELSAVTINVK